MLLEELQKISQSKRAENIENRVFGSFKEAEKTLEAKIMQRAEELFKQKKNEIILDLRARIRDGKDGLPGNAPTKKELLDLIDPLLKQAKDELKAEVKAFSFILDTIQSRITQLGSRRGGRGGGGDTIIADDLSALNNGSTRTYTTTKKIGKPILVVSSQFPTVLRLTTDFTASELTLTLDSSLTPIATGQTLYFIYAEG